LQTGRLTTESGVKTVFCVDGTSVTVKDGFTQLGLVVKAGVKKLGSETVLFLHGETIGTSGTVKDGFTQLGLVAKVGVKNLESETVLFLHEETVGTSE
jgi:hypothetical protein